MDLLMEKLRAKSSTYKSFGEYAKAIRMTQLEKRFPMDLADRGQLQKCLDTLLQSMSVNSLQGMVERLESISRQLSLKLTNSQQTGLELFISSDMFYVEVSLEPTGQVKDVKVHHEGKTEQQSCETLVKALSRGDFEDFTAQLSGLISIYQLNAEKKVKCRAFSALCALETDLEAMYSMCSGTKDVFTLLNTSLVGILERRRGGHTMKLTYFISPYDALAVKQDLTVEYVNENMVGNSVTICLEGSEAHKLQLSPILNIMKNDAKGLPVAAPLTPNNSSALPAYFNMKLSKPMPICVELLKQIAAITELACIDVTEASPIFSLICRNFSNDKVDSANSKGLFVTLPDQVHCYFMTENKQLTGVVVQSIPFTHPHHVPQILKILKQQAVFNSLVSSAVRISDKAEIEKMLMLEVSALSWSQLSITFEHPMEESIATLEIDLNDMSSPGVKLYASVNADTKYISKVLQRCLSIPVTMRSLIKSIEQSCESAPAAFNGAFSSAPNGGIGGPNDPHNDFGGNIDVSKIKTEGGSSSSNGRTSSFGDFSAFSATVLDSSKVTESKKRKHDTKSTDDLEIIMDSTPSDVEREELRRVKKHKSSSALEAKVMATPSVTITPITGSANISALSGMGLERRPGIEIIPLANPPPANLPSSITITPIPNEKEKKSRPLDDRDKKKKRKREDDIKMGPPEKVPVKSDPLSKPVSVSIKPSLEAASSPRPTSPSMRKYTTSPTPQFRDRPSGKGSPSPRHSPVYTSPKHSPKHGNISPKPPSGKPSMTSMKSTGSPTSKNSEGKKSSSSSKDQRDRERKNASSPKIKSSSVKLKQIEVGTADISVSNISPPPLDPKCANQALQRNRKGSLSAVIDKLKSAQEVVEPVREKIPAPTSSTTITKIDPLMPKAPDGVKNPTEYMVKPSSDGMKITINKTRTKDGSKGSSSKTHTGLKPGVSSGPASKKPSNPNKSVPSPKVFGPNPSKSGLPRPTPRPLTKTSGAGSPKMPTDLSKKDPNKPKVMKPEKSIFKEAPRKGSPTGSREEEVLKALNTGLPSSLVKPFDTKFQIPKLSARNNPPTPTAEIPALMDLVDMPNNNNNAGKGDKSGDKPDIKVIEVGSSKANFDLAGLKYQSKVDSDRMAKTASSGVPNRMSLPLALTNISPKLPMTSPNLPTTSLSSITSKMDRTEETDTPTQTEIRPTTETEAKVEAKTEEAPKAVENCVADKNEILLDFSTSQSLQAKLAIVDKSVEKTPAGSTSSVSVTDDDLMDEVLMMRK